MISRSFDNRIGNGLNEAFVTRYHPLCERITAAGKKVTRMPRENPDERGCIIWGKRDSHENDFCCGFAAKKSCWQDVMLGGRGMASRYGIT